MVVRSEGEETEQIKIGGGVRGISPALFNIYEEKLMGRERTREVLY